MAEALLGAVFEKLFSLAHNEFATMSGIKKKAEKLSLTLEQIKAAVEDAEKKEITNKSIKVWLQQLKDAVYVLDDILDKCDRKNKFVLQVGVWERSTEVAELRQTSSSIPQAKPARPL